MKSSVVTKATNLDLLFAALTFSATAFSANDPSIKGDLRNNIQQSMVRADNR